MIQTLYEQREKQAVQLAQMKQLNLCQQTWEQPTPVQSWQHTHARMLANRKSLRVLSTSQKIVKGVRTTRKLWSNGKFTRERQVLKCHEPVGLLLSKPTLENVR
jgi:hypothetical protein